MGKTYGNDYNSGYDKFKKIGIATSIIGTVVGGVSEKIAQRNHQKAQEIIDEAQRRYNFAVNCYNSCIVRSRCTILAVVSEKKQIMRKSMRKFLKAYRRLSPQIDFQNSLGLDELNRFIFSTANLDEIAKETQIYINYNEKKLGNNAFETAALLVQDGTVANLVDCVNTCLEAKNLNDADLERRVTDDAKIQSISYIAEISTLSIGYGISGLADAFSSASSLDDAKIYRARCYYEIEMLDLKQTKINAITEYALIHQELLERFRPLIDEYVKRACKIIKNRDNFFHKGRLSKDRFTDKELEILAFTLSLVGAVKAVIDSPIIAQNGEVFRDENNNLNDMQECLDVYESVCTEMRA